MSHIVFCWELGGGMGHLVPLSVIAAHMVADGHKVSFILRDVMHAPHYLGQHGIEWLQAPHLQAAHRTPTNSQTPINNHADILKRAGYADSATLNSLVSAWKTSLQLLRPDRIVCEYAPTAQLAARILNIPCVCIDNGFSMPPVSDPLPTFHPDKVIDIGVLQSSEREVQQTINAVLRQHHAPVLPRFAALYENEVWYRNWVEFNHFGPHSAERHVGQIFADTGGLAPSWPSGHSPKLFAYIKNDNPFGIEILQAALAHGFRVLAYLPGHTPAQLAVLAQHPQMHISPAPVALSALDEEVAIGIWQSPTGGVGHSLEKGMRMLFIPAQTEQVLACQAVVRSGLPAHVVLKREDWHSLFDQLLAMPRSALGGRWQAADINSLSALLTK